MTQASCKVGVIAQQTGALSFMGANANVAKNGRLVGQIA